MEKRVLKGERRRKVSLSLSLRFKACNEWPLTTEWRKKPFQKTEKWERGREKLERGRKLEERLREKLEDEKKRETKQRERRDVVGKSCWREKERKK